MASAVKSKLRVPVFSESGALDPKHLRYVSKREGEAMLAAGVVKLREVKGMQYLQMVKPEPPKDSKPSPCSLTASEMVRYAVRPTPVLSAKVDAFKPRITVPVVPWDGRENVVTFSA